MADHHDTNNQVQDGNASLIWQRDADDAATTAPDTSSMTAPHVTPNLLSTAPPSYPSRLNSNANPFATLSADQIFGFVAPATHIANTIALETAIHAPNPSATRLVNGHTAIFEEIHRDLDEDEGLFDESVDVKRRERILGGWGRSDMGPGVGEGVAGMEDGGKNVFRERGRGKGRKRGGKKRGGG